jgi:hypothetical protein
MHGGLGCNFTSFGARHHVQYIGVRGQNCIQYIILFMDTTVFSAATMVSKVLQIADLFVVYFKHTLPRKTQGGMIWKIKIISSCSEFLVNNALSELLAYNSWWVRVWDNFTSFGASHHIQCIVVKG